MFQFSIFGFLFRKVFRAFLDSAIKSPLEQDFGEYDESAIAPPEASMRLIFAPRDAPAAMAGIGRAVAGFGDGPMRRALSRISELPVRRSATLAFQVRAGGEHAELQLILKKAAGGLITAELRSSKAAIAAVKTDLGFGGEPFFLFQVFGDRRYCYTPDGWRCRLPNPGVHFLHDAVEAYCGPGGDVDAEMDAGLTQNLARLKKLAPAILGQVSEYSRKAGRMLQAGKKCRATISLADDDFPDAWMLNLEAPDLWEYGIIIFFEGEEITSIQDDYD